MPYPTLYSVSYSYSGFQEAQGDNSFPGTQLDADFRGLHDSVSGLALFVQGVMRSDGALNNAIVTFDSLAPSLQTAGLNPADAWATGTAYAGGKNVVENNALYRCLIAHTSGVFATDLAAGKWVLVTALAVGPQGVQGVPGPQGNQGIQGNQGVQGAPGISSGGLAFADIAALNLTGASTVTALGRSVIGDAPPLVFLRSVTDPAGVPASLKTRSTDGAYWYPSLPQNIFAEHAGGISGATAAVTAGAIQDVVTYAKVCHLQNGVTYNISSQIRFSADYQGLVCDAGRATLSMQTGAGQFDANTVWNIGGSTANAVGLYFLGMAHPILKNIRVTMQASASLRTCVPLAIRNCTDLDVRHIELDSFQDPAGSLLVLDSVLDGIIDDIYIHDVAATDVTLAACLAGGIVIDGNRTGIGAPGSRIRISNYFIQNITQSQASITHYNYQTGGVAVGGKVGGDVGCVELMTGRIDNVAQALDLEAYFVKVRGCIIRNAWVAAVKIVHDAGQMEISGLDVSNTAGPVFVVAGTNSGTVGAVDIDIFGGRYSDIGSLTATGPTAITKAFIATDGGSAPVQPRRIHWHSPRIVAGGNCQFILNMQNGSDFTLENAEVIGAATVATCVLAAGTEVGTTFTLNTPSVVRAALSATATPGTVDVLINCGVELEDTNSEFASGVFTAQRPMRAVVTASIRAPTLAAGKSAAVLIQAAGSYRGLQEYVNAGASGVEVALTTTAIVDLKLGDTVKPFVSTTDGALSLSGDGTEHFTKFQLQEIG